MSYYRYILTTLFKKSFSFLCRLIGSQGILPSPAPQTCTIDTLLSFPASTASVQKHVLAAVPIVETMPMAYQHSDGCPFCCEAINNLVTCYTPLPFLHVNVCVAAIQSNSAHRPFTTVRFLQRVQVRQWKFGSAAKCRDVKTGSARQTTGS
jgi:hypothetical protein